MQLLHLLSLPVRFSRAQTSSSRLSEEQTFIVHVKLALSSPCLKWPQYAWWIIASPGDLRLITKPLWWRSIHPMKASWASTS